MALLSGGQAAVEALKAEKTDFVFGLIGSATMEMFDALYDAQDIKLIGVHDERTGTHMADSYARASGKTGVVLAGQNGPGTTNLVTGLAQAKAAYTPLVSIGGLCRPNISIAMPFKRWINRRCLLRSPKKPGPQPAANAFQK